MTHELSRWWLTKLFCQVLKMKEYASASNNPLLILFLATSRISHDPRVSSLVVHVPVILGGMLSNHG
jgi:hypothetical protein